MGIVTPSSSVWVYVRFFFSGQVVVRYLVRAAPTTQGGHRHYADDPTCGALMQPSRTGCSLSTAHHQPHPPSTVSAKSGSLITNPKASSKHLSNQQRPT